MKNIIIISIFLIPFLLFLPGRKNISVEARLSSQPGIQPSTDSGEKIYKQYCISCHQADGGGVPNMSPALIGTSYVLGDKKTLIGIVLNGLKNVDIGDETYNNPMPPLGSVLKDQQIADVLTFVRNSFGNKASAVKVGEVKVVRGKGN